MIAYLLTFSLISSLFLAASMIVYRLLLSGQRQPGLNRAVLLGIILLSLVALPAVSRIPAFENRETEATVGFELPVAVAVESAEPAVPESPKVDYTAVLGLVVAAGCLFMLFRWAGASRRILSLARKGESLEREGYTLVLVENPEIAPFSFMQRIVISRDDYERNGLMIEAHELAHIRSLHWVDLLLAQAVVCLQWYNPAAWLLLSELRAVHEYEADSRVLRQGFDRKEYQYLLIEKAAGVRFQSLANSLNHSKLKNRIAMMYIKKSSFGQRLRVLALLPAVVAAFAVTRIPAVASVIQEASAVENPSQTSAAALAVIPSESAAPASEPAPASAAVPAQAEVSADKVTEKSPTNKAVKMAEKMPEYPGGLKEMMSYLASNIKYPEAAMKSGAEGRVVLEFVVKTDGTIGDVKVIRSISPELDREAIRVVEAMPAWTPGTVDGEPVNCYYTLPVSFKLTGGATNGKAAGAKKDVPVAVAEKDNGVMVIGLSGSDVVPIVDKPTIFVDGKPFEGSLNDISPNSIESMNIIKNNPDYPKGIVEIILKK